MEATRSFLPRFHELASYLTMASEINDSRVDTEAIVSFVDFLDSVSAPALAVSEDAGCRGRALEIIKATRELLIGLNQEVLDTLSMDMPKAIAKFAGVSEECGEIVDRIIDHLCEICNPRDMLSVLCEALDSLKAYAAPKVYLPLFRGISYVILHTRRCHFEQIKVAVPIILSILESASTVSPEENKSSVDPLFERGIIVSSSIQEVCSKLVGRDKQRLNALLALYILQVMALVSKKVVSYAASSKLNYIYQLSEFLPFCGFSYLNLIVGDDVEKVAGAILGDDNDLLQCFSSIKHGASLAVVWGYISNEAAKCAGEEPNKVLHKLQNDRNKRYKALCLLKHLLSSAVYSWDLKGCCIDFILSIMDRTSPQVSDDLNNEGFTCITDLFGTMQAIELVIVYAPDATIRKKAFSALKSVLSDLPPAQKFDMLHALIAESSFPSMTALLIDLAKEQFMDSYNRARETEKGMQVEEKTIQSAPHECYGTLDLVELVLKPPRGGPPSLPEESDAVVSALNLYRFLIILESSGKMNYSGVLCQSNLQKAYSEWLLPLHTLVSGIQAENRRDDSEIALDIDTSLNLIQLPLYHCIELVEHNLRNPIL